MLRKTMLALFSVSLLAISACATDSGVYDEERERGDGGTLYDGTVIE